MSGRTWMTRTTLTLSLLAVGCARMPADPDQLMAADRAFYRAVADHDMDAFRALVDPEARFFGSEVLEGRDQVAEGWAIIVSGDYPLEWTPDEARISTSGDLGYTIGTAIYHSTDEDGAPVRRSGRYVTIWHRQPDGRWCAVVDAGTGPQKVLPPD